MSYLPLPFSQKLSEILVLVKSHEGNWKADVNSLAQKIKNCNVAPPTTADAAVVDKTPQQTKKRAKRTISTSSKESLSVDENPFQVPQVPLRPVRTAKVKAAGSLKEPSLGTKMRQEPKIKKEKISMARIVVDSPTETETPQSQDNEKEDSPIAVPVPVIIKKEKISDGSKNFSKDDSLEILPPVLKAPIVLSDDESTNLMPPPVPKSRPGRISRKPSQDHPASGLRVTRSKIKQEQVDESVLFDQTVAPSTRSTRSKQKPKKKFAMPILLPPEIKQERIEEEESGVDSEVEPQRASQASSVDSGACSQTSMQSVAPPKVDRTTIESVYEDARTGLDVADVVLKRAVVSLERFDEPTDATFVASADTPADSTYVTAPQAINVDATFNVLNETVDLGPAPKTAAPPPITAVRNALISDDEDDDDAERHFNEILQQPLGRVKHNELFNPCVQSPVKKKVAAFEKHATTATSMYSSPQVTRQTRTKTRQNQATKENVPSNNFDTSRIPKSMTPMKALPKIGGSHMMSDSKTASTSKLAHLKKTIPMGKSLIREISSEDLRRPMQLLADEKRKKREEKQKLAQQHREALEREKREKLRRGIEEKEEKARQEAIKKQLLKNRAQEALQRKQMEEINRDLKNEAKKKAELKALEQQKKLERENAERDALDAIKIREQADIMHQKRIMNLRMIEIKKEEQKLAKAKKYAFEMLNSDDSTDEEDKSSDKRPPPPEWSRTGVREMTIIMQSKAHTSLIDNLFSVAPMTPDLREIFPGIEAKMLKRNSSAVWGTPPRIY